MIWHLLPFVKVGQNWLHQCMSPLMSLSDPSPAPVRWSIWTKEIPMAHAEDVSSDPGDTDNKLLTTEGGLGGEVESYREKEMIMKYEDSVATHLAKILHSDENTEVISSAK